jgi:predicted nucleic acid-binding protein
MIADSTFAADYLKEQRRGVTGPAARFFHANRTKNIRLTIITAGEVSVAFTSTAAARLWLERWKILFLHMGIMDLAADIDRAAIRRGRRLGENDNWIAAFALYYREPLISRDKGFDAMDGLRRVSY